MRLKLHFSPSAVVGRTVQSNQIPVTTDSASFLRVELKRQPEIRPEVIARARALAADPNYPPMDVLSQVAGQILASPDLSEDGA